MRRRGPLTPLTVETLPLSPAVIARSSRDPIAIARIYSDSLLTDLAIQFANMNVIYYNSMKINKLHKL